jgi:hypothetical protein
MGDCPVEEGRAAGGAALLIIPVNIAPCWATAQLVLPGSLRLSSPACFVSGAATS